MTVISLSVDLQTDRTSASSFRKAMLLLPYDRRKALHTLYALCRALDDAVDNAVDSHQAQEYLAMWQRELETAFSNMIPLHPLAQAFQQLHRQYRFDKSDMDAMLASLYRDARGEMLAPSMEALEQYCFGVAGAVGLMAMRIFGCEGNNARLFAITLGHALQLTNILRDVVRDAQVGRIYLPQEMTGIGITPAYLLQSPDIIQTACRSLSATARQRFEEADNYAAQLPTRTIAPALAMRDVYARYWHMLAVANWNPPTESIIPLRYFDKAALTLRACGYLLGRYCPAPLPHPP
jgi:phytoene synthase